MSFEEMETLNQQLIAARERFEDTMWYLRLITSTSQLEATERTHKKFGSLWISRDFLGE